MAKHDTKVPENLLMYPRIGFVKKVDDSKRMGRLWVWIPEFSSKEDDPLGWILCNYCSPFAGSTSREDTDSGSLEAFESTQQSYGFWAIPPDIGNEVIIIFPNGHLKNAQWIGASYKEYGNKMVPGVPADTDNLTDKGKALPVAEYNKHQQNISDPINLARPEHTTRLNGIANQGLINDPVRGTTTSSAQRESPSQVFGMLTPGPRDPTSKKRTGGSSFVMDDQLGSEHITLMTKSGGKIIIDETHELIYIINKPGTAWVQLDKDGNVDIFGAKNISMRAQGDMNIRADGDINIEAGKNVNVKAANDATDDGEIVGEGLGDGGDVTIEANANVEVLASAGKIQTSAALGDVIIFAGKSFKTTSIAGDTMINSIQRVAVQGALGINIATQAGDINLFAGLGIKATSTGGISIVAATTVDIASPLMTSTALNFLLDATGNIINTGSITSSGNCVAPDYSGAGTSLSSLKTHQHPISSGSSATLTGDVAVQAATLSVPAAPTPPEATIPTDFIIASTPQTPLPTEGRINILEDFGDETKYKRKAASISTILPRFPTFEPCPLHEDFNLTEVDTSGDPILQAAVNNIKEAETALEAGIDEILSIIPDKQNIGEIVTENFNETGD